MYTSPFMSSMATDAQSMFWKHMIVKSVEPGDYCMRNGWVWCNKATASMHRGEHVALDPLHEQQNRLTRIISSKWMMLTQRMFLSAQRGATIATTKMTMRMRPLPSTIGPVASGLKYSMPVHPASPIWVMPPTKVPTISTTMLSSVINCIHMHSSALQI